MALLAQSTAEGHNFAPMDSEPADQIVDHLSAELEKLRRERDCLRSALVDAGFSLRAEQIARYARGSSTQS
jgi:hypothetical protein